MHDTLNNLRARPKEEKTAIAAGIALALVTILFIGWLIYFFQSIHSDSVSDAQTATSTAATSTGANGLDQSQQDFDQYTGTSTQFIDVEGNEVVQPISTSTDLSQ